jgi:hypothetical protein
MEHFTGGGITRIIPPPTRLVHIYLRCYTDAICGTPWDHSITDCSRYSGCEWCVVCEQFWKTSLVKPPYDIRARPFLALVP